MRLVTYQLREEPRLGAQLHSWIVDLNQAYRAWLRHNGDTDKLVSADVLVPAEMVNLLRGGKNSLKEAHKALDFIRQQVSSDNGHPDLTEMVIPINEVTLLPPVTRPGKLICIGLNYPSLTRRQTQESPEYPVLFLKVTSSLIGNHQPIVIPKISQQVVYEGELAVVIGGTGKNVDKNEALSYVAGYTIANDVGALDLERRTSQWTTGKLSDTFCPMGPAVVTRDEVPDPNALRITTTLNGEIVQDGNSVDMIFNIPYLVSYLSELTTLEPGDVILSGSPKGIGKLPVSRIPMKPGDTVSIEIEGLGVLTNPVVAEEV